MGHLYLFKTIKPAPSRAHCTRDAFANARAVGLPNKNPLSHQRVAAEFIGFHVEYHQSLSMEWMDAFFVRLVGPLTFPCEPWPT